MAQIPKSLPTILLVLLIVNSLFFIAKCRPLIAANYYKSQSFIGEAVEDIFEGFYIGAIKTGGPSPGGKGHEFTNSHTLGDAKNSGPSPGEGHDFTNSQTPAEVNSGPSGGGKGHNFAESQTPAEVNSGPSGGGKGHDFTNSQNPAHVNSGPSPGQGH